jgi:hypothetical protein
MGKIISSDMNGLLNPQHDPYWDASISRREVQEAINQLAINDKRLADQNDTSNLVLNFLCEKANFTREEIETWVEGKKAILAKIKAGHAKAVKAAAEAPSERS